MGTFTTGNPSHTHFGIMRLCVTGGPPMISPIQKRVLLQSMAMMHIIRVRTGIILLSLPVRSARPVGRSHAVCDCRDTHPSHVMDHGHEEHDEHEEL